MNIELAVTVYYDWMPLILEASQNLGTSPRYDKLKKLLEQMNLPVAG
jgi:ABC-type microcin C transport system permease subunit YejB